MVLLVLGADASPADGSGNDSIVSSNRCGRSYQLLLVSLASKARKASKRRPHNKSSFYSDRNHCSCHRSQMCLEDY